MTNNFENYQLILFAVVAILIARTIFLFVLKKKSLREVIVAIIIWGTFGALGLFPNIFELIAKVTGFEVGVNAVFVFSIIALFILAARQSLINDKLENSITRLVRAQALKELEKNDKKS